MYIEFHRTFKKQYKKLSPKLRRQFLERLEIFKQNRSHNILNNHELPHPYIGCYSINISGDYRALYAAQDDTVTFFIDQYSQRTI